MFFKFYQPQTRKTTALPTTQPQWYITCASGFGMS
jgi:hypothetical protein